MSETRQPERLGISAPTVSFHLNKPAFELRILDILQEETQADQEQAQREEAYRQRVLDSFFEYGKLKSIPVQRKKERIILETLVEEFELGRSYTEREVNLILADFHDDFCTLRRDMISEKCLARENGVYWRLGPEK